MATTGLVGAGARQGGGDLGLAGLDLEAAVDAATELEILVGPRQGSACFRHDLGAEAGRYLRALGTFRVPGTLRHPLTGA